MWGSASNSIVVESDNDTSSSGEDSEDDSEADLPEWSLRAVQMTDNYFIFLLLGFLFIFQPFIYICVALVPLYSIEAKRFRICAIHFDSCARLREFLLQVGKVSIFINKLVQ